LPIIAATRLQLDLLRNESVIDLKRVTEVVLADAGATLQILRLIGEEFPDDADRPNRIEDCIVSLSFARCYQTICASESAYSGPHVAEWHRCRRIAECVREVAIGMGSIAPEEAYLVGLLSRLGTLPQLLGWKGNSSLSSESQALGVMLAFHWRLPRYVLLAIEEQHQSKSSSKWKNILALGQDMAGMGASDWAPQSS
jgi:HD-like signal output (HDOD) protein